MAERITITPEELRSSANVFSTKSGEIAETLTLLRQEVDNLEATWDGAAQDQFFISYSEMETTLNEFPTILEGISTQLTTVADTLEQTDEDLRSALSNS